MIPFLYLGIVCALLIVLIMYIIDNIKMLRKKIPKSQKIKYLQGKLFIRILTACVVTLIISTILPMLIWVTGKKEYSTEEKVINSVTITDLPSQATGQYFVGEETESTGVFYVYQLLGTQYTSISKNKSSDVEIVNIQQGEIPRCDEIGVYNKERLVESKMIYAWANEYFTSISGWKETLKGKKVKLYVPKDTVLNPYTVSASK